MSMFRQVVGQLNQNHIGLLAELLKKYELMDIERVIKKIPPGHCAPMAYVATILKDSKMKTNPKFNVLKRKVGKEEI